MNAVMKMMKDLLRKMMKSPLLAVVVVVASCVVLSMTVLKDSVPVKMVQKQVKKITTFVSDKVTGLLPATDEDVETENFNAMIVA